MSPPRFALVILLFLRQCSSWTTGTSSYATKMQMNYILQFYGDFFRTTEEQINYERKFFNIKSRVVRISYRSGNPYMYNNFCNKTEEYMYRPPPPTTTTTTPMPYYTKQPIYYSRAAYNPYARNGNTRAYRKAREIPRSYYLNAPPVHHGCCTSRRKFVSPSTGISDINGEVLELLQYADDDKRQYFLSQDCAKDADCPLQCDCKQEYAVYKAVVRTKTYPWYGARSIRLDGCCKCINNV